MSAIEEANAYKARQQQILEEAKNLHKDKYNCDGFCPDFIVGAEWAGAHPKAAYNDVVLHGGSDAYEQGYRDAVEKACKWLEEHISDYIVYRCYDEITEIKPKVINDLRKIMKNKKL